MPYRKPTIQDVARVAGVSRAAASRAINNVPGVSDHVKLRVRQVIDDLGYRPNPAAQALASGRANLIDLVVIDDDATSFGTNPFYGRVVAGIATVLADHEAQLRIHAVAERDAPRVLAKVAQGATLGAVLVNVTADLAADFHVQCGRVVALGRSAPQVPAVEAENARGAYTAITHLHSVGRQRIAAIHGPRSNSCAVGRREGHLGAIHDAGLPDLNRGGEFRREAGYLAAVELLAAYHDLDALFVACDLMASGAVQALTASRSW